MMTSYTVKAINLKTHSLGESDKILTLFSQEKGLLRAVAKGSKKTTGKLTTKTDLFQYNELFLAPGKSLEVITQARSLYSFPGLRKNLNKIYVASYWCELLLDTLEEKEPHPELFRLMADSLRVLEASDFIEALLLYFELKLMDFAGYRPHLTSCGKCGTTDLGDRFFFNPGVGGLLCLRCSEETLVDHYISLDSQTALFLNRLLHASLAVASRLKIGKDLFTEAKRITSSHLQFHLAGRHKNYSFLESLLSGTH